MFGSKKRQILKDGAQALAVVTDVNYAKVAGMAVASNYNYKLAVTLMVRPDDEAPFEARISAYFSQYSQPKVVEQFWVRYDPQNRSKVEIDTARIAADNAAFEARVAAQAASAVPADLASGGIVGRGAVVDVQKTPAGNLIDCAVTVGVRLVDGSDPYRATCHVALTPDRADPHNRSRIALSLSEPTPVVTITDPRAIDPPARALREGLPCRVTVLVHQRQWLQTPDGEEFYAIKVRVDTDGSEFQVNLPVPAAAIPLLQNGGEFPAKRLSAEPNILAIDWAALLTATAAA
jgi:hypothetical protein